jgi:NAD+ synthase (glutamine-hydrolysing)
VERPVSTPFYAIHAQGFVRAAVCTPRVAVGDPGANAAQTLEMAKAGDAEGCDLMLFPELGISAYAIDDLLLQDALLRRVDAELARLVKASETLAPVLMVGAPLAH